MTSVVTGPRAPSIGGRASSTRSRARRLRRRLTALVLASTAVCLVALGTVAGLIDARARQQAVDAELDRRATGLSRTLWVDQGRLHLEPLAEDGLAQGVVTVTVLERAGGDFVVTQVHPAGRAVAPLPVLRGLVAQVLEAENDVVTDLGPDGAAGRTAAAPIWGEKDVQAVVVVTGIRPDEAAHRRLLLALLGAGGLLLTLVTISVHLVVGRSLRPVVGVLDRQEQFLAEAAHELRTPLSTLRLVAERGVGQPDQAAEVARHLVRLADQMGRVVAGLLVRTRIQVGSQVVERIPLRLDLLVEQVLEDLPESAAHLTLQAEPAVVEGDPEMLSQAIRNLIENALVHGARPGTPAEVAVAVRPGLVAVQDNGPGLARGGSGRRAARRTGTGLGLPIVRWVAELHGGEFRLAQTPNGGVLAELRLRRPRRTG